MAITSVETKLYLIQAVRSLLYVPIYLAKEKLRANKIELEIVNPTDDNGEEIVGDAEAFNEFMKRTDLNFCVCDPMMVPLCDPNLSSNPMIVGALINRVALWAMTKDRNLYQQVAGRMGKINIFESYWLADKNVISYSRPSTAGAVAAFYKQEMNRRFGGTFTMFETENGLELQHLDIPLDGHKMDVVITADLLAHEAHYNYNKNARALHNFSSDLDKFFFTGIIAKKEMLNPPLRIFLEQVLRAIKESVVELYDYYTQKRPFPAGLIKQLSVDFDKYTRTHLHPQFQNTPLERVSIVESALNQYLSNNIPSRKMAVDRESFSKAFELRQSIEKIPKPRKFYYSRAVDDQISKKLDRETDEFISFEFILRLYFRFVKPYKRFWSLTIPSIAAIFFNVLSRGSLLQVFMSILGVLLAAWLLSLFLDRFDKNHTKKKI